MGNEIENGIEEMAVNIQSSSHPIIRNLIGIPV